MAQGTPWLIGLDDTGYWNQGSQLVVRGTYARQTESSLEFLRYYWHGDPTLRLYNLKYGPGMPLMVAAAVRIVGLKSAFWLQPLLGLSVLFEDPPFQWTA